MKRPQINWGTKEPLGQLVSPFSFSMVFLGIINYITYYYILYNYITAIWLKHAESEVLLWWCHWWLPFHDPRVVRRRWLESSDPNHPDPEAATCVPERSLVAQFLKTVDVVIICWDMLVWVLPSWSLSLLSSLLFYVGFSESIPWTK